MKQLFYIKININKKIELNEVELVQMSYEFLKFIFILTDIYTFVMYFNLYKS